MCLKLMDEIRRLVERIANLPQIFCIFCRPGNDLFFVSLKSDIIFCSYRFHNFCLLDRLKKSSLLN